MGTNTKPILLINVPFNDTPPRDRDVIMESLRKSTEDINKEYHVLLLFSKTHQDFHLEVLNPNNSPEELRTVEELITELREKLKNGN